MIRFTSILLLFASFSARAQHEHMQMATKKNVFLGQMAHMMMKMDEISATTSADRDFIQMMIPHHQGAIDMAEEEIKTGKNKEMIQLAKSIKAEQQTQIQQMRLLLSHPEGFIATGNQHQNANQKMMKVMMEQMPEEKQLSDTDLSFARIMLPHHQAAIDMAKVELRYGKNKNVKRLAENIISDEQIEIQQMKTFTTSH